MDPHSALRSSARHCTQPKPSCRVGGTRSIPPTRLFRRDGGMQCLVCGVGAHRPEGRRDEPDGVLWSRRARGLTTPDGGGTPDANQLAIGGNGVPADRLIEHSGRGQVRTWRDEQRPAREFLAGPQSVRADKPCSHAVRHRGDDVAGKIVVGEQHLSLRASGRRQNKVVEPPAQGRRRGSGLRNPSGYESKAIRNRPLISACWNAGHRISHGSVFEESRRPIPSWCKARSAAAAGSTGCRGGFQR